MARNEVVCPVCASAGAGRALSHMTVTIEGSPIRMRGIFRCPRDSHEWPFEFSDGTFRELRRDLPVHCSEDLDQAIPEHLRADVREAETAHYHQCNNAAVVLCRRALQLALVGKGIGDKRLSAMLGEADQQRILTSSTAKLAQGIKAFGDGGAHRMAELNPNDVYMTIYATVRLLNELALESEMSQDTS